MNGLDLLLVERSLTSEVQINSLNCICEFSTKHVTLSQTACACALPQHVFGRMDTCTSALLCNHLERVLKSMPRNNLPPETGSALAMRHIDSNSHDSTL